MAERRMDPRPRDGAYVYGTQGPYFLGVTHYSYGEGSCTTFIPFLVCYTLADAMVGVSITEFQPLLIPPTWITPRSHRVWLPVTMSTLPSHYPPWWYYLRPPLLMPMSSTQMKTFTFLKIRSLVCHSALFSLTRFPLMYRIYFIMVISCHNLA